MATAAARKIVGNGIDRSPGAVAARRFASEQAIAAIRRQGYQHDAEFEAVMERVVAGEITNDEARALLLPKATR